MGKAGIPTFQAEWDWNHTIAIVGIPTEYTAGIPTGLSVKLKKWNRERETRKRSEEYGVDARNRAKCRGGFFVEFQK